MNAAFTPGKYVRSRIEAERAAAASDRDIVRAMRGTWPRDVHQSANDRARWVTVARFGALIVVEFSRRGYVLAFERAAKLAGLAYDRSVKPTPDQVRRICDVYAGDGRAGVPYLVEEPNRAEHAAEWEQVARDFDECDELEIVITEGRSQNLLRYWGMRNLSMRNKLERGECVDLSTCGRTDAGDYIIPPSVWQDDVDFCDAETEEWIWSIGRQYSRCALKQAHAGPCYQIATSAPNPLLGECAIVPVGPIHASGSAKFYQNDQYECLFLR